MKYLRRLAVLVLPVLAAVSLGVPASAAPSAGSRVLVPGAGEMASASEAGPAAPAALVSYISNQSPIGVGVLNVVNGGELYDAVLPAGQRTDSYFGWDRAQGYYIGPGWCAYDYYWNGSAWVRYSWVGGPYRALVSQSVGGQDVARWEVRAYDC